jgi:hypothetical protein
MLPRERPAGIFSQYATTSSTAVTRTTAIAAKAMFENSTLRTHFPRPASRKNAGPSIDRRPRSPSWHWLAAQGKGGEPLRANRQLSIDKNRSLAAPIAAMQLRQVCRRSDLRLAGAHRAATPSATTPAASPRASPEAALFSHDLTLSEGFKKIRQRFGLFVAKPNCYWGQLALDFGP